MFENIRLGQIILTLSIKPIMDPLVAPFGENYVLSVSLKTNGCFGLAIFSEIYPKTRSLR